MGVVNLVTVLNTEDAAGRRLICNYDDKTKFYNLFIHDGESLRTIGWIVKENGILVYKKEEKEEHRYKKEDAWTINRRILQYVELIKYKSDKRVYAITAKKARLYGGQLYTNNVEEKTIVPVGAWDVLFSEDPIENRRIVNFGTSWYNRLSDMIHSDNMNGISSFLAERAKLNKVYPSFNDPREPRNLFQAFKLTPYEEVKVVIMGNEPFDDALADGLAFSYRLPFAMQNEVFNIQTELEKEGGDGKIKFNKDHLFDVESWAKQGCLMLNQCLSVEKNHERTHEGIGWEHLTERVVREVQNRNRPIVFLLLGTRTWSYERFIDSEYHTVIKADASNKETFIGSDVFQKVNQVLDTFGDVIEW